MMKKKENKKKIISDLKKKIKNTQSSEEKEKLLIQLMNAEAPYAKYIRPYTQGLIEDRIIPFLEEKEQQTIKFAAAVHKMVVYYLDRNNIP